MKKTFAPNENKVKKNWVFIDAQGKILGKVATEASKKLMGKDKVVFAPNAEIGDKVVITNAGKIVVTGDKKLTKKYIWHTGYPKGLRSESLGRLLERKPEEVLRKAIKGMLPKNKLRKERMANLYIYASEEHPHKAQQRA